MSDEPELDQKLERERLWVRSVTSVLVLLIVVGGLVLVLRSCQSVPVALTSEVLKGAVAVLGDVAASFRSGNITTSFVSYGTSLDSMQVLQFGSVKQMEMFTRSHEGTFAFIPMPEVVVEARAPIEYTYFVDLKKEWRFLVEDGRLLVQAPAIEFNTPAVDASGIQYEVKSGAFGTAEVLEDLKKSISFLAREKARHNKHLIRETGRSQVRDFVRGWLGRSFSDGKDYPVEVVFADDNDPKAGGLDRKLQGTETGSSNAPAPSGGF